MNLLKLAQRILFASIEFLTIGEYLADTGYELAQEKGLPLYPQTSSDLFKKLLVKTNVMPTLLQDLRYLQATELLWLGEPLHVVAHRLGHRDSIVTTSIYAQVTDEQIETASESFARAMGSNA